MKHYSLAITRSSSCMCLLPGSTRGNRDQAMIDVRAQRALAARHHRHRAGRAAALNDARSAETIARLSKSSGEGFKIESRIRKSTEHESFAGSFRKGETCSETRTQQARRRGKYSLDAVIACVSRTAQDLSPCSTRNVGVGRPRTTSVLLLR